jgi:hypothetical protein
MKETVTSTARVRLARGQGGRHVVAFWCCAACNWCVSRDEREEVRRAVETHLVGCRARAAVAKLREQAR